MEEQFIEQAGRHLSYMRLTVEGAVSLYEDDLENCDRLIYDLVGEALYALRIHICDLQAQYQQEIQQKLQGDHKRKDGI